MSLHILNACTRRRAIKIANLIPNVKWPLDISAYTTLTCQYVFKSNLKRMYWHNAKLKLKLSLLISSLMKFISLLQVERLFIENNKLYDLLESHSFAFKRKKQQLVFPELLKTESQYCGTLPITIIFDLQN